MSFFNSSAMAIMLKPLIGQYLEPLERNGTIAKLQADIEMLAREGALPALHELVTQLKRHNELLELLAERIKADEPGAEQPAVQYWPGNTAVTGSDTGTAGPIGHHRNGMLELSGPD